MTGRSLSRGRTYPQPCVFQDRCALALPEAPGLCRSKGAGMVSKASGVPPLTVPLLQELQRSSRLSAGGPHWRWRQTQGASFVPDTDATSPVEERVATLAKPPLLWIATVLTCWQETARTTGLLNGFNPSRRLWSVRKQRAAGRIKTPHGVNARSGARGGHSGAHQACRTEERRRGRQQGKRRGGRRRSVNRARRGSPLGRSSS